MYSSNPPDRCDDTTLGCRNDWLMLSCKERCENMPQRSEYRLETPISSQASTSEQPPLPNLSRMSTQIICFIHIPAWTSILDILFDAGRTTRRLSYGQLRRSCVHPSLRAYENGSTCTDQNNIILEVYGRFSCNERVLDIFLGGKAEHQATLTQALLTVALQID